MSLQSLLSTAFARVGLEFKNLRTGLNAKVNVKVATTGNLVLSGSGQNIDGVVVAVTGNGVGDRVLVKNQTNPAENGIYSVSAGAWVRTNDANSGAALAGAIVSVSTGTANGGRTYRTGFDSNDTLDTTAMSWLEIADSLSVATSMGALVPSGVILEFAGAAAPSGYAMCDGTVVSRTGTYAALFAAIGTAYGAGDGATTFNLPNRKGRVGVGRDAAQAEFDVLGETGGAKTVTLTTNEMPNHSHPVTGTASGSVSSSGGTTAASTTADAAGAHTHTTRTWGRAVSGTLDTGAAFTRHTPTGATSTYDIVSDSQGSHSHNVSIPALTVNVTGNANLSMAGTATAQGGNAAHNNLQPYIAMNYIIKI